ncbi:hypothetical protein HMPREF3204_00605 [Gardnerella pickettii]|nr:hypothetical protein HMPREF3204_00605 [Gardnerella pickettii]
MLEFLSARKSQFIPILFPYSCDLETKSGLFFYYFWIIVEYYIF